MRAALFFRIAAVLIVLFAAGHTLGFRQTDPGWGVDSTVDAMKSIRFHTQGFSRSYWDFFVGFGFFVSVLLIFTAITAWQLGSLPPAQLAAVRGFAWALTGCFAVIVLLSWRYFFTAPVVFSSLIFVCLLMGSMMVKP